MTGFRTIDAYTESQTGYTWSFKVDAEREPGGWHLYSFEVTHVRVELNDALVCELDSSDEHFAYLVKHHGPGEDDVLRVLEREHS